MPGGRKRKRGSIRREARGVARDRLARVVSRARTAASGGNHEDVRRLRVATRRAVAALDAFGPWLRRNRRKRLRGKLRALRRATGSARDAAVRLELLRGIAERADGRRGRVLDALLSVAAEERASGLGAVAPAIRGADLDALGSEWRGLVRRRGGGCSMTRAGCEVLAARGAALRRLEVTDAESLHELRIEIKRTRYTLELFGGCGAKARVERLLGRLRVIQDRLGEVNDMECLAAWIESRLGTLRAGGPVGDSAHAVPTAAGDEAPGRSAESARGVGRGERDARSRVGR